MNSHPHHGQPVGRAGQTLEQAKAAMILVHGRGASAQDILMLASELHHPDFVYLAPQAHSSAWYPYRFIEPIERNEPGLSSGLGVLADLVRQVEAAGIPAERIIIGGFSQGSCLASEFVARNPRRYGGLLVFSGGLIGPIGSTFSYDGSLEGTPAFLGCSDTDFHIPLERVHETAAALTSMGAEVETEIYSNMGHTIIQEEIDQAKRIVNAVFAG